MKDQDTQEADATEMAAVNDNANHNREDSTTITSSRKRRLSKRERKNLKKRQCSVPSAGAGDGSAITSNHPASAGNGSNDPSSDDAPNAQHTNTTQSSSSPTLEEFMVSYIPAPPVKRTQMMDGMDTTATTSTNDAHSKSLGKWFPTASVIKSSVCYSNDYLAKLDKEKKRLAKGATTSPATAATDIPEPKASLVLFYQYVSPTWSQTKVTSFMNYLTNIAKNHRSNIGGRIRVSVEGVNATVSAASTTNSKLDPAFEAAQTLRHFAQDLRQFDPVAFADTDFKYVDGLSADRHFKELKLLPVKELVFYGIKEEDCAVSLPPRSTTAADNSCTDIGGKEVKGGVHLDAAEYHEMLKRKDAVVIDVRNHYEAAIGRFDGQMEKDSKSTKRNDDDNDGEKIQEDSVEGGAQYIDPKMRKSTDFTSWLAEPETKQKLEGKTVLMFCTGGIRCERASAYLNAQMGNEVKGVYQLQGGIERYLQAFPEGGFWRGKNFVFDKREAIGAGHVNGVGGVVRMDTAAAGGNELLVCKKDGASKTKRRGDNQLLDRGAECANCHKPWDRYIGKRKCYTCGVPVLVCDTCLSQSSSVQEKKKKKKKKTSRKSDDGQGEDATTQHNPNSDDKTTEKKMRLRCPLCVEEGITVPAEEVEYTDNGVRGRLTRTAGEMDEGGECATSAAANAAYEKKDNSKAAKSVLKWGGGHAAKKKEKNKLSRRPCQFGSECVRKDCFFYHPEREKRTL